MRHAIRPIRIAFICIASFSSVWAVSAPISEPALEEVLIIGSKNAAKIVSGSANFISEQDLERFDQIDLRKILNQVAGVYLSLIHI